jgi:sulfide dehydrogenase cytochrome subunit
MTAKHAILAGFYVALAAPAAAQTLAPPGASACSGCHAPARLGLPVVPVRGRDAKDIMQAMQEFRSGQRAATVMGRIAKGFSDAETQAIAAWLAAQH